MINVSVIGATGYSGIELLSILSNHGGVKVVHATSQSFGGKKLADVYENFSLYEEILLEEYDADQIKKDSDVVFLCTPHGVSASIVKQLYGTGIKIIDLSGDFRYNDVKTYESWYGFEHKCPELLDKGVYGLSEIYRDQIKTAEIIASPGCYTTNSILPLYPLLKKGLIKTDHIIIDAKSGVSGAGRKATLAFSFGEVFNSFKAYGVTTHRHTSEIEEQLSIASGNEITLSFTPHLLPINRGILSTIYADLNGTSEEIAQCYKEAYGKEQFVFVHKEGKVPELKHVLNSNACHIGYVIDKRLNRIVIVSCLDNLVKGASGQAVQNMNIAMGLDENTGLKNIGSYV